MSNLQLLSMVINFPIGEIPKSRTELLSKAEIVSFLSRFQEQFSTIDNLDERELMVRNLLGETLELSDGEVLPSIAQAESTLKLSPGFLQDYSKVQYIKENNPDFEKTYDMLASNFGLIGESPRKTR